MSPSAWTYIHQWTDSEKEAKSLSMQGKLNHFYGKTHAPESIAKMKANSADQSGSNNPFYGKTHSEETKKKISDVLKAKNSDPNYTHPLTNIPKSIESINKMKANMPHSIKCTIDNVDYISISEASSALGISIASITNRLKSPKYLNYTSEQISKTPIKIRKDLNSCIIDGVYYNSAKEASDKLSIKYSTVAYRINSNNYPNYQSTRATTIENMLTSSS